MRNLAMIAFAAVLLQGCVSFTTPMVSSMNYSPESMEVLGRATGEVTEGKILGIDAGTGGDGVFCTNTAIYKALQASGGDALINTSVDTEYSEMFGFLIGWETIRVSGTAIRFKKDIPPPVMTPPSKK